MIPKSLFRNFWRKYVPGFPKKVNETFLKKIRGKILIKFWVKEVLFDNLM